MAITFFTAVKYTNPHRSFSEFILDTIDDYFYWSGKKAYVIQGRTKAGREKVVFSDADSSQLAMLVKAISYCTIALPLILVVAKFVLRQQHSYKIVDPQKKLEKGVNISQNTLTKIQSLLPKILARQNDPEINWVKRSNTLVFKLPGIENYIFKIGSERFKNIIKSKESCLAWHWNLLKIPNAKKFELQHNNEKYELIAEEALAVGRTDSAQYEFYRVHSDRLKNTVKQLASFIAVRGLCNVAGRNIPLIESNDSNKDLCVGLIDLKFLNDSEAGFAGNPWNGSRGFIRCLGSKEQIDIAIAEARKHNVSNERFKNNKEWRLRELELEKQLRNFHEKKGIKIGNEPIQYDQKTLDFSSYPNSQDLKRLAIAVIAEINRQIRENSPEESIAVRRSASINTMTSGTQFCGMCDRTADPKMADCANINEYRNSTFMGLVLNKLKVLGLIYDFDYYNWPKPNVQA